MTDTLLCFTTIEDRSITAREKWLSNTSPRSLANCASRLYSQSVTLNFPPKLYDPTLAKVPENVYPPIQYISLEDP